MLDSAFWGDHFPVKNKNIRKKLRKFSIVKNIFKNNAPKRRCVDFVVYRGAGARLHPQARQRELQPHQNTAGNNFLLGWGYLFNEVALIFSPPKTRSVCFIIWFSAVAFMSFKCQYHDFYILFSWISVFYVLDNKFFRHFDFFQATNLFNCCSYLSL